MHDVGGSARLPASDALDQMSDPRRPTGAGGDLHRRRAYEAWGLLRQGRGRIYWRKVRAPRPPVRWGRKLRARRCGAGVWFGGPGLLQAALLGHDDALLAEEVHKIIDQAEIPRGSTAS